MYIYRQVQLQLQMVQFSGRNSSTGRPPHRDRDRGRRVVAIRRRDRLAQTRHAQRPPPWLPSPAAEDAAERPGSTHKKITCINNATTN